MKEKTTREILFRGKDPETEKWYEGQYIHLHKTTYCVAEDYNGLSDNDIHQIVFERMTDWGLPNQHRRVDVDPSSVGQYIGLKDKNGTKIFEGDILESHYDDKYPDDFSIETVVWFCNSWRLKYGSCVPELIDEESVLPFSEVIGNIFDNPELLEGNASNG